MLKSINKNEDYKYLCVGLFWLCYLNLIPFKCACGQGRHPLRKACWLDCVCDNKLCRINKGNKADGSFRMWDRSFFGDGKNVPEENGEKVEKRKK